MRVIGTAGHVDHGKSTLIAALTGRHPDRLKEEQEREMTIDLGFGWMQLPNVGEVGIVDVPGHRDFIANMLAGVGSIDAAVLVVAADEGVMPQTREHLAILDLLQIPGAVVALTKIDLAPEPGWLDLVEADVRSLMAGTRFEGAPVVRISSKTGDGLEDLRQTLDLALTAKPERPNLGRPRLPVDRVFSMPGFGTVVTGTLIDGSFAVGDEVDILPAGRRGRVRGLQTHKKQEQVAEAGSRTAANLSGIEKSELTRGDVVTRPGQYTPSRRLDAELFLLRDAKTSLRHGDEVKCHLGASEALVTIRLLGTDELQPGETAMVQMELSRPLVAVRGDRFILRRPSPSETLGGGRVLDHAPAGRHRRFSKQVLDGLKSLAKGSPSELLMQASLAAGPATLKELVTRSRLSQEAATAAITEVVQQGLLIVLDEAAPTSTSDAIALQAAQWDKLAQQATDLLTAYHARFPLRRGMPREELKSRLQLPARVFNAMISRLYREGHVTVAGELVAAAGHSVAFSEQDNTRMQALLGKFAENPFAPPGRSECRELAGEEIVGALIEAGRLVPVSSDVLFRKEDYEAMVTTLRQTLQQKAQLTMAEVRDIFGTSRKFVQPFLEHLDTIGVTVREGDVRRLRS